MLDDWGDDSTQETGVEGGFICRGATKRPDAPRRRGETLTYEFAVHMVLRVRFVPEIRGNLTLGLAF